MVAVALIVDVAPVGLSRRRPIDLHAKSHLFARFRRAQDEIHIARMKSIW